MNYQHLRQHNAEQSTYYAQPRPITGVSYMPRSKAVDLPLPPPPAHSNSPPGGPLVSSTPPRAFSSTPPSRAPSEDLSSVIPSKMGSQHSRNSSISSICTSASNSSTGSEKLNLATFVSKYQDQLPLCVKVCKGYCGPTEGTSISEGDAFHFHFVKRTTIVTVEYEDDPETRFHVPINSSVPFGLLYDPNHNTSEALQGYHFQKVFDLLNLEKLPPVVRARKAHTGSDTESSVLANELLILQKVKKGILGKQLKAFSLTTGIEKTLAENCIGHFSTKPREVTMFLSEIVKYLPNLLPYKAVMYGSEGVYQNSTKLPTAVVTMLHSGTETSIVATSALLQNRRHSLIDISLDMDILIKMVDTPESDLHELKEEATYFYDHFSPSKVPYISKAYSRSSHETQSLFYSSVRSGDENVGVVITTPQLGRIYDTVIVEENAVSNPAQSPLENPAVLSASKSNNYSYVDTDVVRQVSSVQATIRRVEGWLDQLHQNVEKTRGVVFQTKTEINALSQAGGKDTSKLNSLMTEIGHLQKQVAGVLCGIPVTNSRGEQHGSRCEPISNQPVQMQPVAAASGPVQPSHQRLSPIEGFSSQTQGSSFCEENKAYLATFSTEEVLSLLEAMGMKQYLETFRTEDINGKVFLECDDEVLATDLKISSKLHRIKLLKVVSGEFSAKEMMCRLKDTYVSMFPVS